MTVESGELMRIGSVASHNIAAALGLGEDKVLEIERAIKDEIDAMSSHFTLAVADVQTHFEIEAKRLKAAHDADVAAVKADYSFVAEHKVLVYATLAIAYVVGVLTGHIV